MRYIYKIFFALLVVGVVFCIVVGIGALCTHQSFVEVLQSWFSTGGNKAVEESADKVVKFLMLK